MCGIAAIIGECHSSDAYEERLNEMLLALSHRGEFKFQRESRLYDGVAAGANRLAFTSGLESQPVTSPMGRFDLFLNGEVYDFYGSTCSDTMALCEYIEKFGTSRLGELDGIFAAILIDKQLKEIYLFRDRFGVKPLYYAISSTGLYIASEIKALAFRHDIEIIQEVPPGSCLSIANGGRNIKENLFEFPQQKISRCKADYSAELHLALRRAVKKQTSDGQKYAIYLSGGVDSSSIYAICKSENVDITPFVLGRPDSEDVMFAQNLCRGYGDELHIVDCPPEAELFRTLHNVIKICESFEPNVVRASALSCILAQAVSAKGFRVALCGEGADELFGGYPEFIEASAIFEEIRRKFLSDLHRTQLQRIDRTNMAATIEVRVPFLSKDVSSIALSNNDRAFFLGQDSHLSQTKLCLRHAMENYLPTEIARRPKLIMNMGAGYGSNDATSGMFRGLFEQIVSDDEFKHFKEAFSSYQITTKEEAVYFKIFRQLGYHKLNSSASRVFANRISSTLASK